jgi:hypothetical protein
VGDLLGIPFRFSPEKQHDFVPDVDPGIVIESAGRIGDSVSRKNNRGLQLC